MTVLRDSLLALGALAAIVTTQTASAQGADASAWSEDARSSARLIAAPAQGGVLRAGVEITLKPGWKTYWRYPGDSGVPPRFEFAGSQNVATAHVLYPAPHAFNDETGTSIGYKDTVIFPIRVTPRDPAKPVTLKLKLEYAVCEKLCIPAQGAATLDLANPGAANDAALAAAEARVPKPVPAAELGLVARRVNGGPKPLVALDFAATADNAEVFVEGPGRDWALPIPVPAAGAPAGRRHFGFMLDGLPPGVDPKGDFDLTFTIVSPGRAVETTTRLD
jgi:DsbC/DsbD-like thiol-disulfide interchange protein